MQHILATWIIHGIRFSSIPQEKLFPELSSARCPEVGNPRIISVALDLSNV